MSNPITLTYTMIRTTHTSPVLGNPSYCFIISLKFAKKEVVKSPTTSFQFIQSQNEQFDHSSIQNDPHNSRKPKFRESFFFCFIISLKFVKKEVVKSPTTSFQFIQSQNEQSDHSCIQNDTHNSHKS